MKTFSPVQVAKMLGVSKNTVATWIRSGEIAAINVGRKPGGRPRYRISQEALDAFQLRRSVVAVPVTRRPKAPPYEGSGVIPFYKAERERGE